MPLPDAPPSVELPHVAAEFDAEATDQRKRRPSLVRPRCSPGQPGEIVVCAADPKRNRLTALSDMPPEELPKARFQISDRVTLNLQVESTMVSGAPSNRATIGVKIGF